MVRSNGGRRRGRVGFPRVLRVALAVLFLEQFPLFAQEPLSIIKGPYLQSPTQHSIVIMWETSSPALGSVTYRGKSGADVTVNETGPVAIHEVSLTDLVSGDTYTYAVLAGDGAARASSPTYRFRTVPAQPEEWRFMVHGDVGGAPDASVHETMARAMAREINGKDAPAFVLMTGDMVNDGRKYGQWGEQFFGPEGRLYTSIPLWPSLGNHDWAAKWYFDFFSLPNNERWYSFDYQNAHFIALDSFSDMTPEGEQYRWLEKDLAAAAKADWVFAYFHEPPYSSGPHNYYGSDGTMKETGIRHAQQYLDPLFQEHGVSMVFSGHNHLYERSQKGKVTYIVTGSVAAPLYGAWYANPYMRKFRKAYCYLMFDVRGDRLTMRVTDIKGKVFDTFELTSTRRKK